MNPKVESIEERIIEALQAEKRIELDSKNTGSNNITIKKIDPVLIETSA